ncbi:MAG: response regulator [Bacteroidales bacterium]|nr:response regulator [Bacteroidales bacterium]
MVKEKAKYNISLLYIEDEHILRDVYKEILKNRVDTLFIAKDGDDGYNKYKQYKPDLIITDIKMPKMNGLEMIKQIKEEDTNVRIVIMSAYGQPEFFMEAIDLGVKGFLLKPVKNEKLFSVIEEMSKEILLEKNFKIQAEKRIRAENDLKKSEAILRSVSYAAEQFLKLNFGEESISMVLKHFGISMQVSRVYIFKNHYNDKNKLLANQKNEWTNNNIEPQIDNPELQNVSFKESGFERWVNYFRKEKPIYGLVKDFPENEKPLLLSQNIKSLITVPIFVNNNWWGFIGFDDCKNERIWSPSEIKALYAAANILGSAIYRNQVELILHELNLNLEQKVEERTHKLQKEINERTIAEKMLMESEEKYRQIFENANDGILLSSNGMIKFLNPKLVELTGFLPKESIGKSFLDFIHSDFKELVYNNHKKRIIGKYAPERYDIQIVKKSGETKWVELKSNLITWENIPSVLTFITDISERKQTAQKLESLNLHLEKRVNEELSKREKQQNLLIQKSKLESLGELAAGIAHEINQPLGGISMGLENILFKLSENEISPEYIKNKFSNLFADIERIRKIIDHVRIFSRDQQTSEFKKVDIHEVINNALSMISKQYENHKVEILLNFKKDCYVYGNLHKLEQIFLNLLSNSKHAIDNKKKTTQDTNYQKQITISTKHIDNKIVIHFEDNGIGISKDNIDNIFEPFYTTKASKSGTGLGLSISYGIINEIGGEIYVESEENISTKIIISLPKFKEAK